jgi:type IV pilus assembly protein PilB
MSLIDVLVQKNIVSRDDVSDIEREMEQQNLSAEDVLLRRGINSGDILASKAEYLNVPKRDLADTEVAFSVLAYIPEESAVHYKFVPLELKDGVLEVGLVDPDNIEARDALNFISSKVHMPFKVFLISEEDFAKVIGMYKGISSEVGVALTDLETELTGDKELNVAIEDNKKDKDTKIIEDAPVTKIVATILRYATEGNASDIHIESLRENIRVRFRVDGVLNTSLVLPIKIHSSLVARVKILCSMRLDEKRKPQDGRFSARIDNRRIDFRVSTFPAFYGEKVVIRLLDQEKGIRPLDQIGMTERNLGLLRAAIDRPYGLILISGPTGSGKSTTLYAMLSEVDREHSNVLSLEDPVEYSIDGVSQSQVHPEIGYDFSTGLRTTLRQDPDVIMVGEIRDKETAQLAVQAALTGHLVLSTIHTNSAIGVIPRLVDMGVDPYLIAPTLIMTVAQRLVGVAAPRAVKEVPIEGSIKAIIDRELAEVPEEFKKTIVYPETVYQIAPTAEAPNGTHGRIAVFEMLPMTKEIEAAILSNPTEIEISKIARSQGMLTMKEDAILKAFQKVIPFEEVNKL